MDTNRITTTLEELNRLYDPPKGYAIPDDGGASVKENLQPCPDCGALVPEIKGPTHRYLGASPGCWAVYGEVLEKEYADYPRYAPVHRLTVDAYAAQHPGCLRRSRSSPSPCI